MFISTLIAIIVAMLKYSGQNSEICRDHYIARNCRMCLLQKKLNAEFNKSKALFLSYE